MNRKNRTILATTIAVFVVIGSGVGAFQAWKKTQADAAKEVAAAKMAAQLATDHAELAKTERELAIAEAKLAVERAARIEAQLNAKAVQETAITVLRDSADHGYMELDYEGKVLVWNASLTRLTGYSEAEMLGHTLEKVMAPEDYIPHSQSYPEWIKAEDSKITTLRLECRLIDKAGKKHKVIVTARKVPASMLGEQPRAIGLIDQPRHTLDLTQEQS
jgi:PAS domain S-box-containing protein